MWLALFSHVDLESGPSMGIGPNVEDEIWLCELLGTQARSDLSQSNIVFPGVEQAHEVDAGLSAFLHLRFYPAFLPQYFLKLKTALGFERIRFIKEYLRKVFVCH